MAKAMRERELLDNTLEYLATLRNMQSCGFITMTQEKEAELVSLIAEIWDLLKEKDSSIIDSN